MGAPSVDAKLAGLAKLQRHLDDLPQDTFRTSAAHLS
jgi:hypothetical protein